MKTVGTLALATILLIGTLAAATPQERAGTSQPKMRTETVRLKYVTAEQVRNLMRPYQSAFGQIAYTPGNDKLVVISDGPENLERLLAAIKEIDVKPADLVFAVQLALGSESDETGTDEALKNDKVVTELRSLLRYRSFTLLDQNIVRTLDQKDAEILIGKGPQFVLGFRNPKVVKDGSGTIIETGVMLLRLESSAPQAEGKPARAGATTLVQTSLSMKSGERTVVGVSRLNGGDKALVLIISGKVLD